MKQDVLRIPQKYWGDSLRILFPISSISTQDHLVRFDIIHNSQISFAYTVFDSEIAFAILLGPTDPCSIAVSMEPFSTLALKGLTWVFATTTKICTIGGSRQDHSLIPFNATNTTLLHVEAY